MTSFFGNNKKDAPSFKWEELQNTEQLEEIIRLSNTKPALIFKHSTRCGISRGVLKAFEKQFKDIDAHFYYLDLLKHRDISNAIAERFDVVHQSPQLLVLKNGKLVTHDSHYNILDIEV